MSPRILMVGSETRDEREARRERSGASSAESYRETLRAMVPGIDCRLVSCLSGEPVPARDEIRAFDAVIFAGSPIQMHEEDEDTRAAARFALAVFEAGLPSFGSCAGLQIAAVATGGQVRPRKPRMEAAFVRHIAPTDAGRGHPLIAGRPLSWDAPAMHSSEVVRLPDGARVLAGTVDTPVEALEIRNGDGVFWGVQYHPELSLEEIAASLRDQSDDLVEEGLAQEPGDVSAYAALVEALGREPERRDLAWRLGLDREVTDTERRRREIRNFLDHVTGA
ncbi:type 1 glutamine amidotransferase [Aureimonas sp. AU4]|uniref:type 1 glutamine amidotransferase n=1 Tax=Aureimonas sp. AU4 TaxID=1638163 RepID=UPI0007827E3F|nr:gamma-glutamyl-gamma-aminobutyrate hydrolase family protein [Aureimonas sp. AU4]